MSPWMSRDSFFDFFYLVWGRDNAAGCVGDRVQRVRSSNSFVITRRDHTRGARREGKVFFFDLTRAATNRTVVSRPTRRRSAVATTTTTRGGEGGARSSARNGMATFLRIKNHPPSDRRGDEGGGGGVRPTSGSFYTSECWGGVQRRQLALKGIEDGD